MLARAQSIQDQSALKHSFWLSGLVQVNTEFGASPFNRNLTPELTGRPTIATTRMKPVNVDERQAEGGRVE
jgi:hypothetical protein